MQLPPTDELVLVSGCHPIRARKVRYYEDQRLKERVLAPPPLTLPNADVSRDRPTGLGDDWSSLPPTTSAGDVRSSANLSSEDDSESSGIRREPMLPEHEAIEPQKPEPASEFSFSDDEPDDEPVRASELGQRLATVARQAALDPDDGIPL
jgi:type IV secretion system protein VirD4